MLLLAGDRRILDAHTRAVDVTMGWVEHHAGVTRIRSGEHIDRVRTGRLAIAQFLHVTRARPRPVSPRRTSTPTTSSST